MIKNIIIFIVFLATIFLIHNYYKRSSLNLKENTIVLKVKEKMLIFDYIFLKSKNLSFTNINILQNKLRNKEGNVIYFEIATAEPLYEFNQKTEEVVKILFEAKRLYPICSINGVRAIQVVLENDKIINLFVDDNDMKELKFFYGLSTNFFIQTIEKLQGLEVKVFEKNEIFPLTDPVSQWNITHHDIDGIIYSTDY